jgi:transposase
MSSIFRRANPAIQQLFEKAGSPKKVMCIPIDYAKKQHTALVCNGEGTQLRAPFYIHNNAEGVDFLMEIIAGLCRKHHIKKSAVLFGGEDGGVFAHNFIHALLEKKLTGVGLNAHDAAKERDNHAASTDKLDLLGIASLIINKKQGRTLSTEVSEARILRDQTHHRTSLVKAQAITQMRIHRLVEQLMPGFLDEAQSGLTAFGRASLWVMAHGLAPRQVLARKKDSLAERLGLLMVRDPVAKAEKLRALAASVAPPPARLCDVVQANLALEISIYEHQNACIDELERDIARHLAPTPGAMLTTVPGIGITLAAALYAEIGDPSRDRGITRMTAYAGLVARLKQTGGPEKEPFVGGRNRRVCTPLKRTIMDIALKTRQYGHEELKRDYERRVNAGQHVRLTMGRRMLRIARHLVRHQLFFLPPSLVHSTDREARRDHYARAWDRVLIKWRDAAAIQQAFADGMPLEEARVALNDLYDLNLSKTSPQHRKLKT